MSGGSGARVAVVGGGIAGLTAAWRLAGLGLDVTLFEGDGRLGGKIQASPFGGLPAVDEGADAFLARVPWGKDLATELGFASDDTTSPATGTAFVARGGRLHPIPGGLVLGVPAGLSGLARSDLMSWRGKARAALDLVLPRRDVGHDSLGRLIRDRFGAEVLERLVDPLVGSINAGDADVLSLTAATPQIATVAATERSLLLGLRKSAASAPKPPPGTPPSPIFLTPRAGLAALPARLAARLPERGIETRTGVPVSSVRRDGDAWRVDDETFAGVVLAVPAFVAAALLGDAAPQTVAGLRSIEYAGVTMVTLRLDDPLVLARLPQGSGYLVPKPEQVHVTAASFSTRKWRHWDPPAGGEILRVSLGRLGNQAPLDFDDETCALVAVKELAVHAGLPEVPAPAEVRVTRWRRAFPQYAPHHLDRVGAIEQAARTELPGLFLAGAGYRGVGIPACIRSGGEAAEAMSGLLGSRAE